jgi:hypothetical protein
MRKPWETVKIKILSGYVLVIGVFAITVWLIYSEFFVYVENQTKINSLNNKIIYFNTLLANLYQVETLERTYAQTGNPKHYESYERLMNIVVNQFDSLSKLSEDLQEKQRADSMVILLKEKKQNLKEIVVNRNPENSGDIVEHMLSEFNFNQDSINGVQKVRKVITDKSESTYVEQKKLKFFERLAYAFSPGTRSDSVLQISKHQVIETDTIIKDINPADSVVQLLTAVMMDIRKESEMNQQQQASKEHLFLARDRMISLQLREMLTLLEKDIIVGSLSELGLMQNKIRKTTGYLIVMGLLSLLIVIVFLVIILRDITKSQRYRHELEKAKAFSDSLLKSKEQFMLSITHDIKTPIASITGYARLLSESSDKKQKGSFLEAINQSCEHIMKLINDLFDFTRLETGKLAIEKLPFSLHHLISQINDAFYPIAASKKLQFQVLNQIALDTDYISDPSRIRQILSNLVSNAIKYTETGSISLTASVEKTDKENDLVKFAVSDTGIGISEEDIQVIFKEFTQVQLKDRERYEGAGLGLSIAQRLVNLLQGSIRVSSKPGEGSCFIVQLPLDRSELKKDVFNEDPLPSDKKRILVLDDDEIFLSLIAETLTRSELQVFKCNSPVAAIHTLAKQPIDLIITDIQIPSMSGTDFISYIQRKTGRLIPVIAMTGQNSLKHEDYPGLHISAFLKKPFLPEELLGCIEYVFNPVSSMILFDFDKKIVGVKHQTDKIPYNLDQIRRFAIDDPESLQRILRLFAESSYENLHLFQQYIGNMDRNSLAELSHKMLAMFRQLEVEEVVKSLILIETNAEEELNDEQWVELANQTYWKITRFIEVFCEEQGISVVLR